MLGRILFVCSPLVVCGLIFWACTPTAKQDVKTAVDVANVLCPDLSCVDHLLADPNVTPAAKAQLRAAHPDAGK